MPRTLRPLLAVLATLAVVGCGDSPVDPVSPPPASDTAPDSLFGASTPAIVAAVAAQRTELAAAANAALAGAPGPAASVESRVSPHATSATPAPADVVHAAVGVAAALPLPIHFAESRTKVQRQGDDSYSISTSKTLDASLQGTTLTIVSTERSEVRAIGAGDSTRPRPSTVAEIRRELTLDACPDASGVAAGRYTSFHRTWFTSEGALASPDAHDRFEEVTADGTVAINVNDLAEIRSYDFDVLVAMRKMRTPGNRPMDRSGTARVRRTDTPPSRLRDALNDAILTDRTGDWDMLRTLDVGPVEDYVAFYQRVEAAAARARQVWRRGDCVEVVPARGSAGGPLAPGATAALGPDARSRVDGTTVTTATLTAAPTAGTIAAPAAGVPHPATFQFTMPAHGGATVNFTAMSRRGIGFGSVGFGEAGAAVGELVNDAAVEYTIAGTDEWKQVVGGSLTGQGQVRSTLRLRFVRRDPDGALHYDVLSENHVAVQGQGELHGTLEGHSVKVRATLDGAGITHNPVGPGDRPLEAGHTLAPDQRVPSPNAGTARFWTRDGQHYYELELYVMQIVPSFQWRREERLDCLEDIGTAITLLDNLTREVTAQVADPSGCLGTPPTSSRLDLPYTFGMISTDWSTSDAVTGSNAMVTGRWDPQATGDITGTTSRAHTACDKVIAMDPTHLGMWALIHAGFPIELSFERQGSCRLTTTTRWAIPVPPEAREAALR